MKPKDYLNTQMALITIGKHASTLDLDSFTAHIEKAESVAPIVDPTLYRKAQENLQAIKKLANAVKTVQTCHQELFDAVLNTEVAGFLSSDGNFRKV